MELLNCGIWTLGRCGVVAFEMCWGIFDVGSFCCFVCVCVCCVVLIVGVYDINVWILEVVDLGMFDVGRTRRRRIGRSLPSMLLASA